MNGLLLERPDPLGHESVEAPHLGNRLGVHL
jgi:hypothetical protein